MGLTKGGISQLLECDMNRCSQQPEGQEGRKAGRKERRKGGVPTKQDEECTWVLAQKPRGHQGQLHPVWFPSLTQGQNRPFLFPTVVLQSRGAVLWSDEGTSGGDQSSGFSSWPCYLPGLTHI